ncbi:MAG TPA: prenyltransferase/squalene oxidase repeat-containing protein [Chryseolinea sp.]
MHSGKKKILSWLTAGDVSIQYQVYRDLIHSPAKTTISVQKRIENEGWGARFLSKQKADGHWGITFYQPKWTSTHYTLLDLKTIGLCPDNKAVQKSVSMVLCQPSGAYGGINLAVSLVNSDVCVNGIILSYASWFLPGDDRLKSVVDYLLDVQMADGGWNCRYLNEHTTYSSVHSTISVLEGLLQFRRTRQRYRTEEIIGAEKEAVEFLLNHNLYQSRRTGKVIDERMVKLSFPCRWRYDILRCLDYMRDAETPYDPRMESALDIIAGKERKDGRWTLEQKHAGQVHFDMERVGTPSRWNTLRCLRVLNYFKVYLAESRALSQWVS